MNKLDFARKHPHLLSSAILFTGVLCLTFPSCSRGNGGTPGAKASGPFEILALSPDGKSPVFLNQTIRWALSRPVDIDSANFNTIAFEVFDAKGDRLSEQVTGRFRLGLDAQGVADPRMLEFEPTLPTNETLSNGGFKARRNYKVVVRQESKSQKEVLRDLDGNGLLASSGYRILDFVTVSGARPEELFRDTKVGGPRVLALQSGPRRSDRVALNLHGQVPVELRLSFDQALNPLEGNVPLRQDSNPLRAAKRKKGRIFLEYDDPVLGNDQWIRAQVEMPVNGNRGAEILIRPEGVLPSNATVRVIVEATLEDLSGESNIKDPAYERVVGSFRTEDAFAPQFGALVMDFENADLLDKDSPFMDPVAEIKDGVLRASFDFEGKPTVYDYAPTSREVILNTNFTVVQPRNGPGMKVSGGVFNFRDIEIAKDIRVRGSGTNPLVFLANGSVRIDGHISVDGGDGENVLTMGPSRGSISGGIAVCGGGAGGKASQNGVRKLTLQAESGWGPGPIRGGGGEGGQIACGSLNHVAAGGGGGSMSTQGDPAFKSSAVQKSGKGGNGSTTASLGGKAGPRVFKDKVTENDFWGRLFTDKGSVIVGELQAPIGGSGGGGGGDTTNDKCSPPPKYLDVMRKGGGGGAGGGVLIIKAIGPIIVGPAGRVSADGGSGGGGEWGGSSGFGGGGGAGAGGMVVLMSATRIDLHTQQGTYAKSDYRFSVTADGNISLVSSYGSLRRTKYPPGNDKSNSGGYGGMGLIQLQAPPGSDADGTGSILDDNIRMIQGAKVLSGGSKLAYLFRGDLRPDPRILAVPYGRFSTAELQWQTTGASVRRETRTPAAAGVRALDSRLGQSGPEWYFAGLIYKSSAGADGYLESNPNGVGMGTAVRFGGGATELEVLKAESNGTDYYGNPAHVIRLTKNTLPDPSSGGWSYANYVARLFGRRRHKIGEFRILSSGRDKLLLDASLGRLASGIVSVEIFKKFLVVESKGKEGLGEYYSKRVGNSLRWYPKANIQIGFAFHKDPSKPRLSGDKDLDRYPERIGAFLYGLDKDDPGTIDYLRSRHYSFTKLRIRFNLNYNPDQPNTKPGPNPVHVGMALPAIRHLVLPYRF